MPKKRKARKVVVLLGSPRARGNSAILAGRIAAGAKAAGAQVESFRLHRMKIAPCAGCNACQKPGSRGCVIDDDMQRLYPALGAADAVVIATPIYWFTMSAQTKLAMDRCYAPVRGRNVWAGKKVAVAMTYADADPVTSGCVNAIRTFEDAFDFAGAQVVGMVYGQAGEAGEIRSNKALLRQARELGGELVA
jgi:multimeric flavodoxin WrbA